MIIAIIIFGIWNLILSFFAVTAFLASFVNHKEIEAIKSWYPFCEIMKIRIDNKEE